MKPVIFCALVFSCALAFGDDRMFETVVGPVDVQLFIPQEANPVRGILVHVFNHEIKLHDRNATLCRELGWAHLNTIISVKENNRPAKIREAIAKSLEQFAELRMTPEGKLRDIDFQSGWRGDRPRRVSSL